MWIYPEIYDVIVVGAGHAGCEAALAAARMGAKTMMLTMDPDSIAKMSCNPAIGGTGKGQIVREIDAIGGEMGKVIDKTGIQFRMLNASKGAAVWSPRAQADKIAYQTEMKYRLEKTVNLDLKQGTVEGLLTENNNITGVTTLEGITYKSKTVIICTGTFMRGLLHIGQSSYSGGRAGDKPSIGLSAELERIGLSLGRLKTGTPPRIHRRSIDFSKLEIQKGEDGIRFSFDDEESPRLPQIDCFITYTTQQTKDIVKANIHRSPLFSGKIQGIGPRYCPSIEDKIIRFADKKRHQIFLEPEGLNTEEIYANGIASSLPFDIQFDLVHSIIGLEKAEITRPAYAIEYDYVKSGQIRFSLETKHVGGLFLAGQINGTSGYEEAAGQGLIAGINAVNKINKRDPFVLKRSEAYIGVMIDDIVTKGVDEPYRIFTSRAEYRLLLRQDNADLRLREYGHKIGLISDKQYETFLQKRDTIECEVKRLKKTFSTVGNKGISFSQLLCRPENTYESMIEEFPSHVKNHSKETNQQIELQIKYAGYIKRQESEISKLSNIEAIKIPPSWDFLNVKGLRNEAKEKLGNVNPTDLGQASRIPGVSPADISVLMVALKQKADR